MRTKLSNKLQNKIRRYRNRKFGTSEWFYSGSSGERSRTYRKKIKRQTAQIKHRNKKLCDKFPWLTPVSWMTGQPIKNKDYSYISLWDDIPKGWISAFGKMLCEEIQESLKKEELEKKVYIEQAKEKYGQLRIYMSGTDETQRIISIYECISENICCQCGRPHVPMLNLSWVSPYCKKCYSKYLSRNDWMDNPRPYESFASENSEDWRIPNELKWKRFSKDEGDQIITVDISDRVKAIEDNWNKKHPNDRV